MNPDWPEQATAFAKAMEGLTPGEQDLTIVFTDITGFSRMIEEAEKKEGAYAAVMRKEMHDAALRVGLGAEHVYVKSLGDGCLFLYKGLDAPVRLFFNAQSALQDVSKFPVRMGVHVGRVYVSEGSPLDKWRMSDPLGHNVNVAHRVMEIARPGAVYITEPVYKRVKDRLPSTIKPKRRGRPKLHNINERYEIWQLTPSKG